MTDRELLELAAKASGIEYTVHQVGVGDYALYIPKERDWWMPLADDGDALRLAVNLGISIVPYPIYLPEKHSVISKQRRVSDTLRESNPTEFIELYGDDPYAATRRAIVRAAAEIGKETK